MSMKSSIYLGFVNGVSCHTQNLASVAWVIYAPEGHVVYSRGVCLRPSSNSVIEYSVVIKLMRDSISNGIRSLEVFLDSQLVVS